MISIQKSVDHLDQIVRLQHAIAANYGLAIRSAADYAVEFEAAQAEYFRRNLVSILLILERATTEEDYCAVQSSFRGELRAYRDQSQEWLGKIRLEMQAAAEAMQGLAHGLSSNGADHEKKLQADLDALTAAIHGDDLSKIRAAVRSAVASISENLEHARRANQFMMAQLHDEIRSLHREIDNERRAGYTDPVSGAWNRRKCEERLGDLLDRGEGFCVVLACLNNFKRVEGAASRTVIEGSLKALAKRAMGIVGKEGALGRWSEDEFVVILDTDVTAAGSISAELAKQLSSRYAIQEEGRAQYLTLRVDTMVVDRPVGGDPDRFRQRLEQSSAVLRGV